MTTTEIPMEEHNTGGETQDNSGRDPKIAGAGLSQASGVQVDPFPEPIGPVAPPDVEQNQQPSTPEPATGISPDFEALVAARSGTGVTTHEPYDQFSYKPHSDIDR